MAVLSLALGIGANTSMYSVMDAIMIRANKHETLSQFAEHATVPVINGLTDRTHPCQIVADIMTFEEAKGAIKGRRIAWTGDGNNVAASWIQAIFRHSITARTNAGSCAAPACNLAGSGICLANDLGRNG